MTEKAAGRPCVFCNSTTDIEWRIKGTGLPVCRRCGATRMKYVVRAITDAAGRKLQK